MKSSPPPRTASGLPAHPKASFDSPLSPTSHAAADLGSQSLGGWHPILRSADSSWLHERDVSVGRLRDMERNEGWVSAGIDRKVDMLVGGVFRLNAKPDPIGLGIDEESARELGSQIQSRWRGYAEDPVFRSDSERELPFAGQMALLAREFVGPAGEALGVLRWLPRAGWPYRTALQVIDADRLSNPDNAPDSDTLRSGIFKDARTGEPVAYGIRRRHPNDHFTSVVDAFSWETIPRWDRIGSWERPKVIHVYDKRRPGQSHGVSRLVAGLSKMRMLSRYSESEIKTAAINATIVGALYTDLGTEYATERLGGDRTSGGLDWKGFNEARSDFYSDRTTLEDARLLTLFPSDRMELNTQPRQTAGYPAFQTSFLQAFASTLGISYEQLSMDWSKTNYSSARAALNEVWRGNQRLRAIMTWSAAMPIYVAWLEDALDAGEITPPAGARDFHDAVAAWTRCQWIGPGRGYVDPVKEAQGSELRRKGRVSTLELEAAEQGHDWEMLLDQQHYEEQELARRGMTLPDTDLAVKATTDQPGADRRADQD